MPATLDRDKIKNHLENFNLRSYRIEGQPRPTR